MKIIRKSKQSQIQTETCGLLTEVLNQKGIPVSIVLADNLKPTKPHYHKNSTEICWVLEGSIELEITDKDKKQNLKLPPGGLCVIEKEETHQVKKNI